MRSVSFALRWLLVVAAITGALYSLLLARAQYLFEKDSAASVAAAVRLVPYNAAYVARLADWQPDKRVALLRRAVTLNPFDSQSWIQLGLYSELQGNDSAAAERYYLKAAEVNHMYLPKWTLANFYFRHSNPTEFFRWVNRSLVITPYSPDPAFVEMWLMTSDAARIAAAVPNRPRTLLQYAWFLSNTGRQDAIAPVIQRLVDEVGDGNPHAWGRDDLVAAIEDRLVAAGDTQQTLQVWSILRKGGWISQSVPSPSTPISNGDFRTAFYPHGFGWMPVESPGVSISHYTDQASVQIEFSGDQSEYCILLKQYIPVTPGGSYQFRWRAASDGISSPSGLAWHLRAVAMHDAETIESGDLLATGNNWELKAPADATLCLLTLDYTRPLGSVRGRGSVSLSSVEMRETQ